MLTKQMIEMVRQAEVIEQDLKNKVKEHSKVITRREFLKKYFYVKSDSGLPQSFNVINAFNKIKK